MPNRAPAREARSRWLFVADMRCADGHQVKAVVRNISANGVGFRADSPPEQGARVHMGLGNCGEGSGTVCWVDGQYFGVRLDAAINPDAFNLATKPAGKAARPHPAPAFVRDLVRAETDARRPGFRIR